MAETVTIHLSTVAQTGGIRTIIGGLGQVKTAAEGLDGWLKRAAASVGAMAAGVIGVTALGSAFRSAVESGVQFNATLEDSKLGIAAILKQFNPQAFKTLPDAMEAAGRAIDDLKKEGD